MTSLGAKLCRKRPRPVSQTKNTNFAHHTARHAALLREEYNSERCHASTHGYLIPCYSIGASRSSLHLPSTELIETR